MGKASDVLKMIGSKTLDGVRVGGSAINKEIDKALEESKRKRAVYKEEYDKALKEEKGKKMKDSDEDLRRKAREDAKKRVRGK